MKTPVLPAPLVPADADLTDFAFMPLDVRRLRDSRIASAVSGEGFRCAVLLWCAAWHQKPAGSLPDDDMELSQLAGFGRAIIEWRQVREEALYGWSRCEDGKLYHPVVAEKVNEAWAERQTYRWRKECDRLRKVNLGRKEQGLLPLELPRNPTEKLSLTAGSNAASAEIPAENALKGQGQGQVNEEDAAPRRDAANHASVVLTPEAELYRRGKEIMGPSAGGFVKRLVMAKGGNVALARSAIETASTKGDPREYLGAIINGSAPSSRNIGGMRSSRNM